MVYCKMMDHRSIQILIGVSAKTVDEVRQKLFIVSDLGHLWIKHSDFIDKSFPRQKIPPPICYGCLYSVCVSGNYVRPPYWVLRCTDAASQTRFILSGIEIEEESECHRPRLYQSLGQRNVTDRSWERGLRSSGPGPETNWEVSEVTKTRSQPSSVEMQRRYQRERHKTSNIYGQFQSRQADVNLIQCSSSSTLTLTFSMPVSSW